MLFNWEYIVLADVEEDDPAAADDEARAAAKVANAFVCEFVLLLFVFVGVVVDDNNVEELFKPFAILANLFIVSDVFVTIWFVS